MGTSDYSTPEKLIAGIIAFIKREREVFGDFSPGEPVVSANQQAEAPPEKSSPMAQPELTLETDRDTVQKAIDNCTSLEVLKELCKKAELLKTDLEGTNLVFGVGNPNADLMLIGEAPGEEEDRQKEPFVGAAGKLLNKILAAIDFDREDVYIANILKHRPPNNRDPLPEERQRSLPFLMRQIELIDPKLILCLGKVSAQTLLNNKKPLGKMRGRFHKFMDKYELLVTYHPAALLYHPKWKRPTWEDVQMLRERYDELGCNP